MQYKKSTVNKNVRYHVCKVLKCRKKSVKGFFCLQHMQARYRANRHKIRAAYVDLKTKAKEKKRGPFLITYEEFEHFVKTTKALRKSGGKRVWDIVRIVPSKGYVAGNLMLMKHNELGVRSQALRKHLKNLF